MIMKKQQSLASLASQRLFLQVSEIKKKREIVLMACLPFSARYHIFQRSVRIDTDFTLLVY